MQTYLRKYGVQTIVNFYLWEVDGVDLRTDAADGGTDCTIRKDQGADTTADNDFVDEGLSYSLTIEIAEMQAKELLIHIIDADGPVYLDEVLKIETYGHASAQHALDLDDADGSTFTETGGDGAQLTEAGGDGDHLVEAGGDGDQLTAINLPNQTMDITGSLSGAVGSVTGDTKQTANNNTILTALQTVLAGITSLAEWLGLIAGKQTGDGTARTEMRATGAGSGTFDETTDSEEAIRDTAPLGTAMRGTDSAATEAKQDAQDAIITEGRLAELDAGNLPTDVAAIPTTAMRGTDSAATEAKQDAQDAIIIEARLAELDAGNLPTDIAAIPTTAMRGTDSAATETKQDAQDAIITEARLAELDGAKIPGDVDTLLARITALIATKAEMDTAHGLLATPAQVNAQMLDVLNVDTFAQPGQVAMPATVTIVFMLQLLYKALRNLNKVNTTTGVREIYNDDGATVDHKAAVSDDGLIFTEGELGVGP